MKKLLSITFSLIVVLHGILSERQRSFPYHVGVFVYSGWWFYKNGFVCSGSFIGDEWILTVARCYKKNYNVEIYYGDDYFDDCYRQEGKILITHEDYKMIVSKNIALIKISPIVANGLAKAISIPNSTHQRLFLNRREILFTGWSWKTQSDSKNSLGIGDVYLYEFGYCEITFGTELCGKLSLGSDDIVNPGSPLVYDSPSGRIQIGSYIDNQNETARFISLIERENIKWIEEKIFLWRHLH